jgi:hypothetical protein
VPVTFQSILFERVEDRDDRCAAPAFLADLNLDQVINAVTAGKAEYDLKPFFYCTLRRRDAIEYRHEIMRDLENPALFGRVNAFAQSLRAMREHLTQAENLRHRHQQEAWLLDAVEIYCDAVGAFAKDLSTVGPGSRGFAAWRDYLAIYAGSPRFKALLADTKKLKAELSAVKYCVLIKGGAVKVRKCASEADYGAEIEAAFAKFKHGTVNDDRAESSDAPDMNHIEANILDFVVKLYPDIFRHLDGYCEANGDYPDETVTAFDREIQFYLVWLDYISQLKNAGLQFCYPRVSDTCKEVYDYGGFDLALADKLVLENASVVRNDFHLRGKERVIVVSGPNQCGKTTFARMFGQLHYLASLGCPVPGRQAQLFLFDELFTHFEREEHIANLRGKLQDDLMRTRDILKHATPGSVIIMNEIFTSTTLHDAIFLSKKIMAKIVALDALCVWVTFIDELASFGEQTVSMTSSIVAENPALRTYKIVRRPADGLAYAMAIAEKYRLTDECIKERVKP